MDGAGDRQFAGATTLPLRLTSFVGRAVELERLDADLAAHRLVTLTGPGGAGKSRLAAEAAERAGRTVDAVWWVSLGSAATVDVGGSVLGVLGLPDAVSREAADHLVAFFAGRRALLVLDDCEHVVAASAGLVVDLLRRCPELVVLATSREPLGVPGELVREVPPLARGSTQLFLDRARAVRPELRMTPETSAHIAEICERLDGLPLAIELAAARARVMTVRQILDYLGDGLALLAAGPRTVADRHRTMEACIGWSHDLLSAAERTLLRRLSVFAGSFGFDAVTEICAYGDIQPTGTLDLLDSLIGKSLVMADQQDDGPTRYRLLATVRAFAAARLADAGEDDPVHNRLLGHALVSAAAMDRALDGANARVVRELAADLDNLRVALSRACARADPDAAAGIAAPMAFLLLHRGRYREARDVLTRALELPGGSPMVRGRAVWVLGFASWYLADDDGLRDAVTQCLRLAEDSGDVAARGRAYLLSAWWEYAHGCSPTPSLEEGFRCAELADDTWVRMEAPAASGVMALLADDHVAALAHYLVAVPLCRAHGNDFHLAWVLFGTGACHLRGGELAKARAAATEAGALARGVGDRISGAYADYVLAQLELASGRPVPAAAAADRGIHACEEAGSEQALQGLIASRAQAGILLGEMGAEDRLAAAVAAADRDGSRWEHIPAALALARRRVSRGDLAGAVEATDAAERSARRLGGPWAEAAVSLLRGLIVSGTDPAAATAHLHDALTSADAHHLPLVVIDALDAVAPLLAAAGRRDDAARVLGVVEHRRAELGYPRGPAEQARYESMLDGWRPAETDLPTAGAAALTLSQVISLVTRGRGPRAGRPSSGWASLTPTEQEVATLAAEGLSNAVIGARLFIAPGTVKTHLGRVYAKVGVANRAQLGAAARRQ